MGKLTDLDKAIFNYKREYRREPEKVNVSIKCFNEMMREPEARQAVKLSHDGSLTIMGIPSEKKPKQTEDYIFE
ncbi:hypothetical protein M5X00_29935 [Paenibacillus alvei]|uniref:Uncharacterized protein n=1 Tax=Paenibacillus alvei TaxID=44250 RepID=A0ABT4H168_PAEAL|nr:hypothetical protein [Paenibacillus alvei]EJW14443.1 hypothetical protein PAV_13c00620 [Paenibacillus alvei DSM 29]MCY9543734.1 hypothetical protein [Paenibacillus alvei]MCY9708203.1 hypothetical protein [Paenibacillus alvei]MCY9737911.1 hypothetical protein [Paenibacillus alvei]MCY9758443.1 hypothetical protein [Paenibacillus alvei]